MNEESIKLIESLAAKLGITTQLLWETTVRQAHVSAMNSIAVFLVFLFFIIASFVYLRRVNNKDLRHAMTFFWFIFSFFFFIVAATSAEETAAAFFNPEFWAIKKIASLVGGMQ